MPECLEAWRAARCPCTHALRNNSTSPPTRVLNGVLHCAAPPAQARSSLVHTCCESQLRPIQQKSLTRVLNDVLHCVVAQHVVERYAVDCVAVAGLRVTRQHEGQQGEQLLGFPNCTATGLRLQACTRRVGAEGKCRQWRQQDGGTSQGASSSTHHRKCRRK